MALGMKTTQIARETCFDQSFFFHTESNKEEEEEEEEGKQQSQTCRTGWMVLALQAHSTSSRLITDEIATPRPA